MITLIIGTNRTGALSRAVGDIYAGMLAENGAACQILDLKDLPPDFLFSALYENIGTHTGFNKVQEMVDANERFVFIVPEYNGSFPGILKAFLDGLRYPGSLRGKLGALVGVSSGTQGASLALSHMTDILHYLGMVVLPQKPRLTQIEKYMEDGNLTSPLYTRILEEQIDTLLRFPPMIPMTQS